MSARPSKKIGTNTWTRRSSANRSAERYRGAYPSILEQHHRARMKELNEVIVAPTVTACAHHQALENISDDEIVNLNLPPPFRTYLSLMMK